ncbi:MAG: DUF4357 domain-containing protein [Proteobacteria bacterium]|nr:MAG: DUF4357 domain-containing protein [Pseudomonadota bacterium]
MKRLKIIVHEDAVQDLEEIWFYTFQKWSLEQATVPSISPSFLKFRQRLLEDGILVVDGDLLEFSEDYIFSSPSTAAVMVMGRNANGLEEWKLSNGTTLRDFEIQNTNNAS